MNGSELKELHKIMDWYLANKAAYSLSTLLNEPVEHEVRRVLEVKLSDLEQIIPDFTDQEMCCVYLKGEGDVSLGMLLFLPPAEANSLASRLLGRDRPEELDLLGRSSISEMGNMLMGGSFLNALSDRTGFQMRCSVPGFAIETFRALLDAPVAEVANIADSLIITDAELHGIKSHTSVHIIVLLDPHGARKLLASSSGSCA